MCHSVIAPSSAGIWGSPNGCRGYVNMSLYFPETEESESAREGTAAHELGEALIAMGCTPDMGTTVGVGVKAEFVGQTASNGVIYTDEMFDAAWIYANDVVREYRSRSGKCIVKVEHKITAPRVHAQSFGTCDCFLYDEVQQELIIWDYKHGFGFVEAFENWQAINYAAGLFDELGIDGGADQRLTVKTRIAQPRAFHPDGAIREWTVVGSDLRGPINQLANAAKEALGSDAKIRTGAHCRYCEALHACPSALRAGMTLFEFTDKAIPQQLSPEAMGVQLQIIERASKQLEYLKSAFEEQVKSSIRQGTNVIGWSLKPGKGRKKWNRPKEQIVALGDMMGIELRKNDVITPTQARNAGMDENLINAYSERPDTALKLTQIDTDKVTRVFNK